MKINISDTEINGMKIIDTFVAKDIRGSFIKDYSASVFKELGLYYELKETFYTISHRGVVRGIHFQRVKQQAKLVRCIKGKIYDVCVDLRKDSETFGKWKAVYLDTINNQEVLIPEGCGHGYIVLEDSIVSYKCNEVFYGEYDDGIVWNDKRIGVEWPMEEIDKVILSDKDKNLMSFEKFKKIYGGF